MFTQHMPCDVQYIHTACQHTHTQTTKQTYKKARTPAYVHTVRWYAYAYGLWQCIPTHHMYQHIYRCIMILHQHMHRCVHMCAASVCTVHVHVGSTMKTNYICELVLETRYTVQNMCTLSRVFDDIMRMPSAYNHHIHIR